MVCAQKIIFLSRRVLSLKMSFKEPKFQFYKFFSKFNILFYIDQYFVEVLNLKAKSTNFLPRKKWR
jgi:hypothetical protein